eukprot:INCI8903.1.p1 GENE.INCI8903.1~~INCI8903.1.p1  ORF type:complete len:360 (-),score=45.68 INCI8903.1:174-1115(-)
MPDNTVPTNELSVWLQAYTAPVLLGGAIAWFVLFSIAEFVVRATTARSRLVREAAPTTPEGEKPTTVQGFAFLAISTLHSATVACLMIYCLPSVLLADPPSGSEIDAQLRFGFFQSVGLQRIETLVYIAGYTYTSWALFEVLFFTLHWRTFGKVADMFHHVLFSVTGVYFMSEADACGFYAVVLMAMETSTPWLNIHLAFRGSGGEYRRMLGKAAGIVYFLTMLCFRVAIPGVIFLRFVGPAVSLLFSAEETEYTTQVVALGAAQALNFALQIFWMSATVCKLCRTPRSGYKDRIRQKRAAAAAGLDPAAKEH